MDDSHSTRKILIVDDLPDTIALLREGLKSHYDVLFATNGEDALRVAAEQAPDLILLDIVMPGMNGYEVCGLLKDNENTKRIPIVFLTAKGDEEDELRGFEHGAVDFISKPFSMPVVRARVKNVLGFKDEVENLLRLKEIMEMQNRKLAQYIHETEKLLKTGDGGYNHFFRPLSSVTERAKILIVDDDSDNISLLWEALKDEYDVIFSMDGEGALQQAVAESPDLILLDIMMPGMDGYDVCRGLKADKTTWNIPIIFLTAKGEETGEIKGFETGAVDYIIKPVKIPSMKIRIRSALRLKKEMDRRQKLIRELKELNEALEKQSRERIDELRKTRDESEEKYRNLIESAPDGIGITSLDGEILSANTALLKMLNFGEAKALYKMNVKEFYENPNEDRAKMIELLKKNGSLTGWRVNLRDARGRVFPASMSLCLIQYEGRNRVQSIVRDVTDIVRMEIKLKNYAENLERMVEDKTRDLTATIESLNETREQLAQHSYQAGKAEIVTSVLHNIGNAVTPINMRISQMMKDTGTEEIQSLTEICDHLESGKIFPVGGVVQNDQTEILKQFISATTGVLRETNNTRVADLEFVHKGIRHIMEIIAIQQKYAGFQGVESNVDLNDLLKDVAEMFADSLGKRKIRIEFDLGDIPKLILDRNKMMQVVINILKNAYEAIDMAPMNEKRIHLGTRAIESGVEMTVSDTGIGILPEHRASLFKFDFSTKEKETGFGLHDSANYIKSRGGTIQLLSEGKEMGTQAVIRLPLSGGHHE